MNIRKNWISSDSNYSSKEEIVSDVKENFDIRRYYSAEGKSVIIDNIETQVIIQSHLNPLNEGKYDKKIHMPIETVVDTGSIVEWEGNKWIIISNIDNLQAYKTASMIKSNNTLKFYDKNSILYEIPCIVGKGNLSLEENKFLSIPADEYVVAIPNTVDTLNIDENTRFILSGSAYSVVGIDNISNIGLLNIRVKEGQIVEDDNIDLGIANYYSHQSVKEIYILNGTSANLLFTSATLQLNILCKDNGVIISNPTVTYSSSNTGIATVSSTGLITCVGTGDVVVTVTYGTVSASITIHGEISEIDDYNIVISPTDTTLKLSRSIVLTAKAMKNGVEDSTREFIWSLSNLDESSNVYATITPNDDICTVLASSISSSANKYVVVKVKLTSDVSVYTERQIKIINLF